MPPTGYGLFVGAEGSRTVKTVRLFCVLPAGVTDPVTTAYRTSNVDSVAVLNN